MVAFSPRPVRIAWRTHSSLITGSMPGIPTSTSETWLLGSPPNAVDAPENSFDFEVTWAWISMPITTSQSPVWPLISFPGFTVAFIDKGFQQVETWAAAWASRNGWRQSSRGNWHPDGHGAERRIQAGRPA